MKCAYEMNWNFRKKQNKILNRQTVVLIEQALWKTKKTADSSYFWWCFIPHLHFSARSELLWQVEACWECSTTAPSSKGRVWGCHNTWTGVPAPVPWAQCTAHRHLTVPQHTSARQHRTTLPRLFIPLFHQLNATLAALRCSTAPVGAIPTLHLAGKPWQLLLEPYPTQDLKENRNPCFHCEGTSN